MSTTGIRADNFNMVVPSLGSVVGGGTLDARNNMNFNMIATVNSSVVSAVSTAASSAGGGVVGQVLGGGANCKGGGVKVPFQIHGTTANPQFAPDVGGAAASLLKSQLSCAGGATNLTQGLAGAAGSGGTANTVNQLTGLLGGKKKKP